MPYIFHFNNCFSLIDATPKNGVFCQFFSSSHSPKSMAIHPQYTTDYSAHMDSNGKLYVAVMPDAFHLNYYLYEGNRFTRHTLISNTGSNYDLTSPIIYTFQNIPYIIYLSHQTNATSYNFVQDNLHEPQLATLLTCSTQPTLIKHYVIDNQVFIFFVTYDESYHLNVLQVAGNQIASSVYLNSPQPITDYSICIEDDTIHITYIAELHGKYQLSYFNTHSTQITTLATTQSPCYPVVFCYYNMLWINARINHKLQMLISIDNGKTFSLPAPCSLQNNIHRCYFLTHKSSPFFGQEVYASITSVLKLCTLSMIDFPRFHPDSIIAPELELLFEGLILAAESSSFQPAQPFVPENIPASYQTSMPQSKPASYQTSMPQNKSASYQSSMPQNKSASYQPSMPQNTPTSSQTSMPESKLTSSQTSIPESRPISSQTSMPENKPTSSQTSIPKSKSASSSDTLAEAKDAFMNELTGWDLPPRV